MTGKFQSILLGAMIVGLLATLFGLVQFSVQSQLLSTAACCTIPSIGALVSTWHYASTNAITIRAGEGAMIGLAACILGYVISVVLTVLISFTGLVPSPFDVDAVIELTRERMLEAGSSSEEIDKAVGIMEQYFYLFSLIAVVMYALLGAVVGAIGANIFKHGAPEPPATV